MARLLVAALLAATTLLSTCCANAISSDAHKQFSSLPVVTKDAASLWPRPPHTDGAKMARWLAHITEWGTLAGIKDGHAIGGIVSHSDGPVDAPTGRLFFYMTRMDEVTRSIDDPVSYTLTEVALASHCQGVDAEEPTCARATFLGLMKMVEDNELDAARKAMFARHPTMAAWPEGHHFIMFELIVSEVHVLDYYGGMKIVPHADYYSAALRPAAAREGQ